MKPVSPTFNTASSFDTALRITSLIILYWILMIDLDDRHKKEFRRLDRQRSYQHQQERKHRFPKFTP